MPLIYITGSSASGKSTISKELSKQGFETHGVDEEGYADWVDRKTGEVAPLTHEDLGIDLHDWYKKYRWVLSQERIGQLKRRADDIGKPIVLAGYAEGEEEVRHFFDKVIYLAVNSQTIKQRIADRQDNSFGKDPEEMAEIIQWLSDNDEKYRNSSAIVIDANRPLDIVVKEVIEAIK